MIPRFLVPINARPPNAETTRRRPSTLDERTLIPATLPVIPLNGHSNIPTSLPLESVAARTVVPRDIKREEFVVEERPHLPLQPTDLDERITVPQGAAPPEILEPVIVENIPLDLVDRDIFMTGEVNLLSTPTHGAEQARWDLIKNVSSFSFHIAMVLAIIFWPRLFPHRGPTPEQLELARRQMTLLVPPGAFETPRPAPRREPTPPPVKMDPRVLRRVAPPEPQPAPAPKQPERVAKELPSAPVPQPNATPPAAEPAPVAKSEAPKQPLKLEKPEEQQTQRGLILPKNSPGGSIRDSIREAQKMNAPVAIGGGGQLPSRSATPGGRGQALIPGPELLTDPQGVDFNDYLMRVYVTVKRNWFAVMPASVELGDKGVVSLQFKIMKNGSVPEDDPRRVFGSGKEPLDRAAISSIRSSNPFEPLPPAFRGDFIELRFTYYYNLQPDYSR